MLKDALEAEKNGSVGVFYWNKNMATALMTTAGVTMPQGLSLGDGHIHSIRENGSPVKPKMQNVTESQQFKRWFGDWQNDSARASKVVDKEGNPLVVYHGTNTEFYVFQKGNKRTRGKLNFGEGYYFTSSRAMAENYADGENGRVMETYVAIHNPYTVYWSTFGQSDFDDIAKKLGDGTVVTAENVTQCLQRLGYDGVIERTNNGADNPIRTVVAFESAQIKSATDNIGTYDGGNDNILYSDPEDDIDNRTFSYNELVAKGDLQGVVIGKASWSIMR